MLDNLTTAADLIGANVPAGDHYWAVPVFTEFGWTVSIKYGRRAGAYMAAYALDLNGAHGLVQCEYRAARIAKRINLALRHAASMDEALAKASEGDILRGYWLQSHTVMYDANRDLPTARTWPANR